MALMPNQKVLDDIVVARIVGIMEGLLTGTHRFVVNSRQISEHETKHTFVVEEVKGDN